MLRHSFPFRWVAPVVPLCVLGIVWAGGWGLSEAKTSVVLLPTEDGLELQYGDSVARDKAVIPLHRTGDFRYFSTGVGLEEREADYPVFPLKIVLVVGGKPYLTHVAVTIADENGSVKLTIPKEEVTGPWLFVDLPSGVYQVSAEWGSQKQMNKAVTARKGITNTIYLRWPEPRVR